MNVRLVLLLTGIVCWFGCGTQNAGPGESNQKVSRAHPQCEMAISGAVTATLPCTVVAGWDSSKNVVAFGITGAPQGTVTTAQIALGAPGAFHTGTFSSASSNNYGATVMTGSSGVPAIWVSSSNPVRGGGVTINITSAGAVISTPAGQAYTAVRGTADATLAGTPETGANGTVTMHATF